jgi:hypothetical protein
MRDELMRGIGIRPEKWRNTQPGKSHLGSRENRAPTTRKNREDRSPMTGKNRENLLDQSVGTLQLVERPHIILEGTVNANLTMALYGGL